MSYKVASLILAVAITCVTARSVIWDDYNSVDDITDLMMMPIDELNEDDVKLLPENKSESKDESLSISEFRFSMPIAAAVLASLTLLICCCFCSTRLIVQWDVYRRSRIYEESKKKRATDIARILKLNEANICEKCDNNIKK